MFPVILHVKLLWLSFIMVILLSCLISDLQRSSIYWYRYTAILSFRSLTLLCYSVYMWHLRGNQGNGYKEGVENDKTMQFTV